ncbi:MAG: lipid II flippase MurJ, partial [Rhodobacteraceae bacterium]
MLSKHIKNKKEFKLFAGNIISWLLILLIFLVLIAEIFMPQLIIIIASGFTGSEKFNLSVD